MKQLNKVYLSQETLEKTTESLRVFGDQFCEGLVLWLGEINKEEHSCRVTEVITPEQTPIKSEDGVGYFVNSKTLLGVNKLLSETGLRLLAQVHSHPGRAYHSPTDDRYCIVTMEGGFSVVVPDFGFGPPDLSRWATYRLNDTRWEKLSKYSVKNIFVVEGYSADSNHEDGCVIKSIKGFFGFQ